MPGRMRNAGVAVLYGMEKTQRVITEHLKKMRHQLIEISRHPYPGSGHRECNDPDDAACLSFSMTARRSGHLGQSKPRGGRKKKRRRETEQEARLCGP